MSQAEIQAPAQEKPKYTVSEKAVVARKRSAQRSVAERKKEKERMQQAMAFIEEQRAEKAKKKASKKKVETSSESEADEADVVRAARTEVKKPTQIPAPKAAVEEDDSSSDDEIVISRAKPKKPIKAAVKPVEIAAEEPAPMKPAKAPKSKAAPLDPAQMTPAQHDKWQDKYYKLKTKLAEKALKEAEAEKARLNAPIEKPKPKAVPTREESVLEAVASKYSFLIPTG